MKSKLKYLSFHSFLKISIISLVILICLMIMIMKYSYISMTDNQNLINESVEIVSASTLLQNGSDELTENIWLFVSTKDERFAKYYLKEAYETKTRDKGLEILNSHSFVINYNKLEDVKIKSDDLLQKELWLMRLVYESENNPLMPEVVAKVKLSDKELALSSQEQYNLAREYLIHGEYNDLKSEIDNEISEFNQEVNKIIQNKIKETNKTTYKALKYKYILFSLFISWCIGILIVLNNKIFKPILSYIKTYSNFDDETKSVTLVTPKGMKEVYLLGEVYNKTTIRTEKLKASIEEKNIELEKQKNTDELTKIYNRGFFTTEKWKTIQYTNYTLFCVDMNCFKEINDNYGHIIGDKVLIFVADNLKNAIRKSDVIIRMGGDEFALIIKDTGEPEIIDVISERL